MAQAGWKSEFPLNSFACLLDVQHWTVPGGEGLQMVVGEVKHPEMAVACQKRDALVCQVVIGHVELLQAAEAVRW